MRGTRIAVVVSVILAGVASAETFTVPLPVSGYYTEGTSVPIEFDLGVGLLQVYEGRFICEGTITAGLDYWWDPHSWFFYCRLDAEPGYKTADGPWAGEATYPMPEPFAGESDLHSVSGGTWDFLCDGHATGDVEMPASVWIPEWPPRAPASGYLEAASIVIEAEVMLGDFDGTRCTDLHDFAVLASGWRSSPPDDNWNPACDISDPNDNIIDERDLSVFVQGWLVCCQ